MTSFVEFMLYGLGIRMLSIQLTCVAYRIRMHAWAMAVSICLCNSLPVEGEEGEPGEGRHPSCNVDLA